VAVDIAIFAAAVADWRVANEGEQKLKKTSEACRRCNWWKIRISGNDLQTAGTAAAAGDRISPRRPKI